MKKKLINTILFILLYLINKEILHFYFNQISDLGIIFNNFTQVLKYEMIIAVFAFLLSFVLFIHYYYYKFSIKFEIIIYIFSLVMTLFLGNKLLSSIFQEIVFDSFLLVAVLFFLFFIFIYIFVSYIVNVFKKNDDIQKL